MKRYFSILTALCLASVMQAQQTTPNDALRLTDKGLNGTARYKAMSGAFGAVGGDLSAININPAGSALFNHNVTSFSFGYNTKKNISNYFDTKNTKKDNGIELGQMGAAFVFQSRNPESTMKKFVIGVNYETTKNLNNTLNASGINPNNSLSDYFLDFANYGNNGMPFNPNDLAVATGESVDGVYGYLGRTQGIGAQQAFLGYQEFLYDYDETQGKYVSNMVDGPYLQENYVVATGFNGKLTGNFGTQLGDRIYLGANLNLHFVDFTNYSSAYQHTNNTNGIGITSMRFENEIYTYGNGFSFNLGGIAQVTDELRVGLAYESPTWYRLNDELVQSLSTVWRDEENKLDLQNTTPNVVNVYDKYTVQTPASFTGSLAYVFAQKGLLSIDYTLKDYSNTKMKPTQDFSYVNSILSNDLTSTSEIRIGAEYRINQFSLRGGYRFEESPYKSEKILGDLNSFSAGIGYDFGATKLDLAYGHASRSYNNNFISSGMTDAARVNTKENVVSLTYSIKF